MIITANGNAHTVDILKDYRPVYNRALKFFQSYNGKTQVSDRGANADKYKCSFTVIGDISDINDLVTDLYNETGQVTINTEGFKIFGSGIDHSGNFDCNISAQDYKYPIRDIKKSLIQLTVDVVSQIVYDSSVAIELPELLHQFPVDRSVSRRSNAFQSISYGDYGNSVSTDSTANVLESQVYPAKFNMRNADFAKLHRYVANLRGNSFTLNTNAHFEPFLGSTSESVKVLSFRYRPDGINRMNVEMELVNNI